MDIKKISVFFFDILKKLSKMHKMTKILKKKLLLKMFIFYKILHKKGLIFKFKCKIKIFRPVKSSNVAINYLIKFNILKANIKIFSKIILITSMLKLKNTIKWKIFIGNLKRFPL